jgi:hypothetical protein
MPQQRPGKSVRDQGEQPNQRRAQRSMLGAARSPQETRLWRSEPARPARLKSLHMPTPRRRSGPRRWNLAPKKILRTTLGDGIADSTRSPGSNRPLVVRSRYADVGSRRKEGQCFCHAGPLDRLSPRAPPAPCSRDTSAHLCVRILRTLVVPNPGLGPATWCLRMAFTRTDRPGSTWLSICRRRG